jgi:hypothetical protein
LLLVPFFGVQAFAGEGDNFDDKVNPTKWGSDIVSGHGVLTQRNHRLEYTCSSPTLSEDGSDRLWKLTRFPYNANWEIQIDTFNITTATTTFQVNSFGINLLGPHPGEEIYNELYASALGFLPMRYGFSSRMDTADVDIGGVDSSTTGTTNGAVRMAFDSATKVITVSYDTDVSDGYQWIEYGSFGVAGSGGTNVNTDWHLTGEDQFTAYIYGYSAAMVITSGQMYGDNFMQTGGVTPSGGPTPVPTGNLSLRFPTNNPLLTRIVSLTGNYQGMSALFSNRNYNVDVAQDESGKLSGMGTLDGVMDKSGNPELSGNFGAIKTVNNEPTVQIKGSFAGTADGIGATLSGSAAVPAKLVDIGGGTNGVAGTASYKGKVGGVPFAAKNVPLQVPAQPGAVSSARVDWTLQLDINRKVIKNKEQTVASAQLVLPNGDTIAYPDKVVRYSTTKGYSLSFKRGTNVTINPNKIDKKSSITIKGLTFVQSGSDWEPTGGVITYQFLGQKGTASLLDFIAP